MEFPVRIITVEDIQKARKLIEGGYRHQLLVNGSQEFKHKVSEALRLIEEAGYYDFIRAYIREVVEVEGFSQLREADAMIWVNRYIVEDPVDAASCLIRKAQQMKDYLEGRPYFGPMGETGINEKGIEFLKVLKDIGKDCKIRKRCEEILELWDLSKFL